MERERGGCNRPQTRFAFEVESRSCVPFLYAGCGGNMNNFETEIACLRFCSGVGADSSEGGGGVDGGGGGGSGGGGGGGGEWSNDAPIDGGGERGAENGGGGIVLGFTLSGPLRRAKHTADFTERVRDYLLATFGLEDEAIRDLVVRDDNTIRFNLVRADAARKAANISHAVRRAAFSFACRQFAACRSQTAIFDFAMTTRFITPSPRPIHRSSSTPTCRWPPAAHFFGVRLIGGGDGDRSDCIRLFCSFARRLDYFRARRNRRFVVCLCK